MHARRKAPSLPPRRCTRVARPFGARASIRKFLFISLSLSADLLRLLLALGPHDACRTPARIVFPSRVRVALSNEFFSPPPRFFPARRAGKLSASAGGKKGCSCEPDPKSGPKLGPVWRARWWKTRRGSGSATRRPSSGSPAGKFLPRNAPCAFNGHRYAVLSQDAYPPARDLRPFMHLRPLFPPVFCNLSR